MRNRGWRRKKDFSKAKRKKDIDEIQKMDKDAEILLFGTSMGGATVLFASGEKDLSSSVKAVILPRIPPDRCH